MTSSWDDDLKFEELYGKDLDNRAKEIRNWNLEMDLEERLAEREKERQKAIKEHVAKVAAEAKSYERDKKWFASLTPDKPIECPYCHNRTLAFDGKAGVGTCTNRRCGNYGNWVDRWMQTVHD